MQPLSEVIVSLFLYYYGYVLNFYQNIADIQNWGDIQVNMKMRIKFTALLSLFDF